MRKIYIISILLILLGSIVAQGKVRLPAIVGDNMVLQQNSKVNIWGWSEVDQKVIVTTSWNDLSYECKADKKGKWIALVDTPQASKENYMILINDGEIVSLQNILIGEVWICSGQSNMNMPLNGYTGQPINNALQTVMKSGMYKDRIRYITVPLKGSSAPMDDFDGKWDMASAETAGGVSALGYYFAQNLTDILDIPIGIIACSWGGSRIEAWMTEESVSSIKESDVAALTKPDVPDRSGLSKLYNGLLYPLKNYTARGFLWYQGESNRDQYSHYNLLMANMVKSWRTLWGDESMPFYYVQIAPHWYNNSNDITCPLLVESQMKALILIPNSGIVSTTDIGEEFCIHPPQKDILGLRMANLALTQTYKIGKTPPAGPVVKQIRFDGNKAIIGFDNAPVGLYPRYEPIVGFEIAGEDRVFFQAKGMVNPDNAKEAIVSSDKVAKPVAVRYAFRNYMKGTNLQNTFGMAAFPFRSDNWDNAK